MNGVFVLVLVLSTASLLVRGQISSCPDPVPNPPVYLEDAFRLDSTGANNSMLFNLYFFGQDSQAQSGGIPFYNNNLYVSNWADNHVVIFNPQSPPSVGAAPNYTTDSGGAQGMKFDSSVPPQFYWAERTSKQITVHTVGSPSSRTVLTDNYKGMDYNAPRDLVIRNGGIIYFIDGEVLPQGPLLPGLYRYMPSNGHVELLSNTIGNPTGLVFSPDQRTLYVSDGNNNLIRKFSVNKDGSVNDEGNFVTSQLVIGVQDLAGPQGLLADVQGNIYASGQAGEILFTPTGTHIYSQLTGRPAKDQRTGLTSNYGNGGAYPGEISTYYAACALFVNRIRGCIGQHPTTGACAGNCWGALLATDGACCTNERCTIVANQGACAGGNWLGEGSRCTPGRCLDTRGACCQNDGACEIVGNDGLCNGGSWKGVGFGCEACFGACCSSASCSLVPNGNCADDYLGDGTICSACAEGACCIAGNSTCEQRPAGLCTTPDVFVGPGSDCGTPDLCLGATGTNTGTAGACCVSHTCLTALNQAACDNTANSQWLGVGSTCQADTCLGSVDGTSVAPTDDGTTDTGNDGGTSDGGTDGGTIDGGDGDGGSGSRLSLGW